jgi:hypothetical protein
MSINQKINKDTQVLAEFINIYCSDRHGNAEKTRPAAGGAAGQYIGLCEVELCDECRKLFLHAVSKRVICPYDPKPSCKKCTSHCYAPGYREKIREVMRYSGMQLMRRGKFSLIKKYFS